MEAKRRMLVRHFKEMLEVLESPDTSEEDLVFFFNIWPWWEFRGEELHDRLAKIEQQLERIGKERCRFSGDRDGSGMLKLITGLESRIAEDQKYVTSWLKGSEKITIVDPYFFSFGGPNKVFRTVANYSNWIELELIPRAVRELTIFHLPGPNGKIIKSFRDFCMKREIRLINYATNEIHDRVLIKDSNVGRVLGTSFGGLGNKIAFMLDLPYEDLQAFKSELYRISQA